MKEQWEKQKRSKHSFVVAVVLFQRFNLFIWERESEGAQAGGAAEGVEEADYPLSTEPHDRGGAGGGGA